jgi:hypothetical protein
MHVTTIDRVQPTSYTWQPATTAAGTEYIGRHRKTGLRMLTLRRLRYAARHLVLIH